MFKDFVSDCNTLLVSGPDGIADNQITSSESSGTAGTNTTSLVHLNTEEQVTPDGVKPGGWVPDSFSPKTPPWIQVYKAISSVTFEYFCIHSEMFYA